MMKITSFQKCLKQLLFLSIFGLCSSASNAQVSVFKSAFDSSDSHINGGLGYSNYNNIQAYLSWQESYIMSGYLNLYRSTKDVNYLKKYLTHVKNMIKQRDDVVRRADYRGQINTDWVSKNYITTDINVQLYGWLVHAGLNILPMADYAQLVINTPNLHTLVSNEGTTFLQDATWLLAQVKLTASVHDDEWDATVKNYKFESDAPVSPNYKGYEVPHNMYAVMGSTFLLMSKAGDNAYLARVTQMAKKFKSELVYNSTDDTYKWQYWAGNHPLLNSNVEDIGHGAIDVQFAYDCYERGIVFTKSDMQRFANTFLKKIYKSPLVFNDYVDGSGTTNQRASSLGNWLFLANIDSRIYQLIADYYKPIAISSPLQTNASYILAFANCAAFAPEACTSPSIGGSISALNTTVCANTNNFPNGFFQLSGFTGEVLRWEYSTNNSVWYKLGAYNSPMSARSPSDYINLPGTAYFRAVVKNGNCPEAYSAVKTVNIVSNTTATITGDLTVCPGQTTTLTASGGATYKWSNGATTPSVSVGAGTFTVTATNAAGCSASKAVTVTQAPPSVSGTIASQSANLSIYTVPSGFFTLLGQSGTVQQWEWSTNGTTWNNWGGANTTTNTALAVGTSTIFYVRVLVKNGNCTAVYTPVKTIPFTVTPTSPCAAVSVVGGTTGKITVSGLGTNNAYIQVLNSLNQSVSFKLYTQANSVIPVKNGKYSVVIYLYSNTWQYLCNKTVQNITVSGSTLALIANATTLELAAMPELNRVHLAWVNNTGDKNDYFDIEKLNETSGNFEKLATLNSKNGNGLEYYTTYDESPNDGENMYRINLMGLDGSKKTSNLSTVKFSKTPDFRIFPNPTSDYIDVDLKQYEGKAVTLQIYNSFGKLMTTHQVDKATSAPVHLEIGTQANGKYLLRVTAQGRRDAAKKFVIQR